MASGAANDVQHKGSLLQNLAKYSLQTEIESSANAAGGVSEAQPSGVIWKKPIKLNLDVLNGRMLPPQSARKIFQRQLFTTGSNAVKASQNGTAARKTLGPMPRHEPWVSSRRLSTTNKAPLQKPRYQVNKNRPSFVQRRELSQWKTQGSLVPGSIRKQKISANITKKTDGKVPTAVCSVKQINSITAGTSQQMMTAGRAVKDIQHHPNLENSVNLLNVDDIEEKLLKESSVLQSQILKQAHKNLAGDNSCDRREQQKILSEQITINEKLDKTLNELADLKLLIHKLSLNQVTTCRKCSCDFNNEHITDIKLNRSTNLCAGSDPSMPSSSMKVDKNCVNVDAACSVAREEASGVANNSEHKDNQVVSEEQVFASPKRNVCVPDSESKSYSLRRSVRLNNKDAQSNYESLRKSTRLLVTPIHSSTRNTNTPARITRKVIAQLNELYAD